MHTHIYKMMTWEAQDYPVSAMIAVAKCECGAQMGPTQIERRLNAVEMLSAGHARGIAAVVLPEVHRPNIVEEQNYEALLAYARILEGETT